VVERVWNLKSAGRFRGRGYRYCGKGMSMQLFVWMGIWAWTSMKRMSGAIEGMVSDPRSSGPLQDERA
jgi:hypothetical protein